MTYKAKILLLVSGVYTFAFGLSNIFINIFLWKKANDFILIAQYNLIRYIFIPITFILAGYIAKKKNGIWPLRIGIFAFSVLFIIIVIIKDDLTKYIYPLGILFGSASGFYWLSFHVLTFDFTSPLNRDTFHGINGCIVGVANAIAPFTSAYIIERSSGTFGYSIVFTISLLLFLVLIFISLFLKSDHYKGNLVFKKIFSKNNKQWALLRSAFMAWGLRDVVIIFLVTVLIFKTTGSELALGKLTLISYFISSISYILEQKIIKPKRRRFSIHIGAFFMFIAILGLSFKINYTFLFIYVIIDAIAMPFFTIPMTSATYNILNINHEESLRIEYIINKEIVLNLGRIISTGILITLLTFIRSDISLNYFLLFIGSSQFISLYLLRKLTFLEK